MRFEKVWVEQCRATKTIKRHFGAKSALDYLIGEKLMNFADAARDDPAFARELPPIPRRRLADVQRVRNCGLHREPKTSSEKPTPTASVLALNDRYFCCHRSATTRADRIPVSCGPAAARKSEGLTRQRPAAVTTVAVR